jgi:2-amino-4-hydroxy-6-hydroxymethyldihydropteridine diphosphokinase
LLFYSGSLVVLTDTFTAYIGIGSNLAEPARQIRSAHAALCETPGIAVQALSSLYRNPPVGPQDQPDYVNAVIAVETALAPHDLLHALQAIENRQGRIRTQERWGARTLDLDLLLYGAQQIHTDELTVPHPRLGERAFVLIPLYEIAPDLTVPGLGTLSALAAKYADNDMQKLT